MMSLQVTKLAKKKSCTVPEGPLSREYIMGGAQRWRVFLFVMGAVCQANGWHATHLLELILEVI